MCNEDSSRRGDSMAAEYRMGSLAPMVLLGCWLVLSLVGIAAVMAGTPSPLAFKAPRRTDH